MNKLLSGNILMAILIITIGFGTIIFANLSDAMNNRVFDLMFLVGSFYFSSSHGSTEKDKTISKALDQAQQLPAIPKL